jgi:prepilin-type N-terminal cleavage/methylation domain-containing protein
VSFYTTGRAFTLVELLVVIVIVVILTGMLLAGFLAVKEGAKVDKTRTSLELLQGAIQQYRNDTGSYPPSNGHPDITADALNRGHRTLYRFLMIDGPDAPYIQTYLEGDLYADGVFLDAWQRPFIYFHNSDYVDSQTYRLLGQDVPVDACVDDNNDYHAALTYQLWSVGENGRNDSGQFDGTNFDDIASWQRP